MRKKSKKGKIINTYEDGTSDMSNPNLMQKGIGAFKGAFSGDSMGGAIAGAAGVASNAIGAFTQASQIADTSGIEKDLNENKFAKVQGNNQDEVISNYDNMLSRQYNFDEIRGQGFNVGSFLGAGLSGASSGASMGGLGAAAGAGIGMLANGLGSLAGRLKAKRKVNQLNSQVMNNNNLATMKVDSALNGFGVNQAMDARYNYAAEGGLLNIDSGAPLTPFGNRFVAGGALNPEELTEINNGGTHEENPNEGVQIGVDSQGIPNMVEEGETVFNNYVFSNRLKPNKTVMEEFKLPAKYKDHTYSDISKLLQEESKERPYDSTSKRTNEANMDRLARAQEATKYLEAIKNQSSPMQSVQNVPQKNEQQPNSKQAIIPPEALQAALDGAPNYSAFGGPLNTFAIGGLSNPFIRYVDTPTDAGSDRQPVVQNVPPALDLNGVYWRKASNPYGKEFMRGVDLADRSDYRLWTKVADNLAYDLWGENSLDFDNLDKSDRLVLPANKLQAYLDSDLNDNRNKFYITADYADNNYSNPVRVVKGDSLDFWDHRGDYIPLPNSLKDLASENGVVDPKGEETYLSKAAIEALKNEAELTKGNKYLPYLRYAPALGGLVTAALNLKKPDMEEANLIRNYSDRIPNVEYNLVGNYLQYRPFDRNHYLNQLSASEGASRRALANQAGGNSAAMMSSLLASNYNAMNQRGALARQAEEYNENLRRGVEEFNRQTNTTNSTGLLQAAQANQQAAVQRLQGISQAAQLMLQAKQNRANAISAGLTNMFTSLGGIGTEAYNTNTIKTMNSLGYERDAQGNMIYKGNKDKDKKGNNG